jgi:ribosomal protein S18 acetylase RimI-like enzyme
VLIKNIRTARELLESDGFFALIKRIKDYIKYHIKEKWHFTYFKLEVDELPYSLPKDISLTIKIAEKSDIQRIISDVYPYMTSKEENDKRYIEKIGLEHFQVFISEREGRIVNYSLLFEHAQDSPLIQTPIKNSKVKVNDAYLGTIFTVPDSRGLWIVPQTLLKIISYLKDATNVERVLLIVHKDTPGAEVFYKRLGFSVINNASPKNLFDSWFK